MQVESKCSEEAKVVFVWFFGVLFGSRAIDCITFKSYSGGTVSFQPIGISINRAASIVEFVSLKTYTSYWTFLLCMSQSRRFSSKSISILPCRLCYQQVLTGPTGCCSHELKSIRISRFRYSSE